MIQNTTRFVPFSELESFRLNNLNNLINNNYNFANELKEFIYNSNEFNKEFKDLNSSNRSKIHQVCSEYGINSESKGTKNNRILYLTKPNDYNLEQNNEFIQIKEIISYTGYIGLKGPYVEFISQRNIDKVPDNFIKNRIQRDSLQHHITIINKREISSLVNKGNKRKSEIQELLLELKTNVKDDWIDLGLGYLQGNDNNSCYYQVIQWESANNFRIKLGLEKATFHITLGFHPKDIHDISKDKSTIIIPYINENIH